MYWNVSVERDEIKVNNRSIIASQLESNLRSARDYRPSPYLIVKRANGVSCSRFKQVVKPLGNALDCKKNYCFMKAN